MTRNRKPVKPQNPNHKGMENLSLTENELCAGPKGTGKTFQTELAYKKMNMEAVVMSAGVLCLFMFVPHHISMLATYTSGGQLATTVRSNPQHFLGMYCT